MLYKFLVNSPTFEEYFRQCEENLEPEHTLDKDQEQDLEKEGFAARLFYRTARSCPIYGAVSAAVEKSILALPSLLVSFKSVIHSAEIIISLTIYIFFDNLI